MVRNDHGVDYVENADASTNQAESFFSRARRAEIGILHRMAGKYLDWYATDLAWREDAKRLDFRAHARRVLASALAHPGQHEDGRLLAAPRQGEAGAGRMEPA